MMMLIILAQIQPTDVAFDWLTRGGMIGILATLVIAFLREWVVAGSAYKRMEDDRDAWKNYALRILNTADKAVTLADKDVIP